MADVSISVVGVGQSLRFRRWLQLHCQCASLDVTLPTWLRSPLQSTGLAGLQSLVFSVLYPDPGLSTTPPLEMPLSQLGAIDAPQNTQEGDQEKGNRGETTDKAKTMQEKTDKQTTALVRVQLWRTRGCGAVTFNMFAQPLQLSELQLQSAWLAVSPHSP